jgi:hypothetical protein
MSAFTGIMLYVPIIQKKCPGRTGIEAVAAVAAVESPSQTSFSIKLSGQSCAGNNIVND